MQQQARTMAHRHPHGRRVAIGAAVAATFVGVLVGYGYFVRPELFETGQAIRLSWENGSGAKALIAAATLAWAVFETLRRLTRRPLGRGVANAGYAVLAVAGVSGFINFGDPGDPQFLNLPEFFHYYLGAKYADEIGYRKLYTCATVAQAERSEAMRSEVLHRVIRDLDNYKLIPTGPVLEHPEACKSSFTPERWQAFVADVAGLRDYAGERLHSIALRDHGYNPTPVWTMMWRAPTMLLPPASRDTLRLLAMIDWTLLGAMFVSVYWAFGLRAVCFAIVFWGTQYFATLAYSVGDYARFDWIFALMLALGCLRRRRPGVAGVAIAYAAAVRIFPGFLFAIACVPIALATWRTRRLDRAHLRFVVGFGLTLTLLVGASAARFGVGYYRDFVERITWHGSTAGFNHLGLPTALSYNPDYSFSELQRRRVDGPQFDELYQKGRNEALAEHAPVRYAFYALAFGAAGMILWRRRSLLVAVTVGVAMLPVLIQLSNYYFLFLMAPAVLATLFPPAAWLALATAGVSAMAASWAGVSVFPDDRFAVQSVIVAAYGFFLLALLWPRRRRVAARAVVAQADPSNADAPRPSAALDQAS
jgi:hypothetical protein